MKFSVSSDEHGSVVGGAHPTRTGRRSWPIAVAVALAVVIAGAGPGEPKKEEVKSEPAAKPRAAKDLTDAEAEADALAFVRENHAELGSLLAQLKAMKPDEYHRAVRELAQVSLNLAAVKAHNPKRYATGLEVWKARSRVDLIAARLASSSTPRPDQERLLRQAVEALVEAEVRQQKLEKETVEERLRKLNENLERLESNRGPIVEARYQSLLKKSQRARRQAGTEADRGAGKTRTTTQGDRQP